MAGFGELVKSLVVRFSSENWQLVKRQIDSIPDHKTVKIDIDRSSFNAAIHDLAILARDIQAIERSLGSGGGGGGGFFSKLLGSLAVGPLSGLQGILSTPVLGPAVLAGAVSAAGALLVEITGLVNGFAAAAAGVGAFGLLARPTFSAVSGAITQIAADTLAYQRATTATARSTALAHIKADWAALDPAQKQAVKGVMAFQDAFGKLATKFEPQVMKVFNDGLKVLNNLLGPLSKFANAAAPAIDGLVKDLAKFTSSKGFKDWVAQFSTLIGPAITAIGHGIGGLANAIGKQLTALGPQGVKKAIDVFFRVLNDIVAAVPKVVHAFTNIGHAVSNMHHAWDNVSHAIDNVRHAFDNIGHAIGNVIHAFGNIGHAIGNFNHAIDNIRHAIAVAGQTVARFFTVDIPHWISIGVGWFKGLPGRIVSAVGNLGHLLFNAGASIIHGLISGIQSALGGLMSILHSVTSLIPSWKGPLDKDRQLLFPSGQAIMGGLMTGIGSQVPALHGQLTGITRGIGGYGGVRGGIGAGGGVTINVNVAPGTSPNETARQIQKMLLQLKRNNGGAALGLA